MQVPDIARQLLTHLQANVPQADQVGPATDLLELGVLDSLLVADLFVVIETRFGVSLSASDVSPQNFRSVQKLAELVAAKQQKLSRAA